MESLGALFRLSKVIEHCKKNEIGISTFILRICKNDSIIKFEWNDKYNGFDMMERRSENSWSVTKRHLQLRDVYILLSNDFEKVSRITVKDWYKYKKRFMLNKYTNYMRKTVYSRQLYIKKLLLKKNLPYDIASDISFEYINDYMKHIVDDAFNKISVS
jgi:hypothetical protein